jgi:hypothetical protein
MPRMSLPVPTTPAAARCRRGCLAVSLAGIALALSAGAATASHSPPPTSPPKLVLHAQSAPTGDACAPGVLANCALVNPTVGLSTPGIGPHYYVYLLALRGTGESIAGLEAALDYQGAPWGAATDGHGIDIFEWTSCATAEFRADGWPAAGSSNIIVWDRFSRCQTGTMAVAGYFYVAAYSPDVLSLTPHVYSRKASVANCESSVTHLSTSDLGQVRFGGGAGCNPCVAACPDRPIPTPPTPPAPGPVDSTSGDARLFVHVAPRSPQANCASARLTDPMKAVTEADLTPTGGPFYNVFLLVDRGSLSGLAGVECRISYQGGAATGRLDNSGIDIFAWSLCADSEVRQGSWPSPLGSNRIFWNAVNNCRVEPVSVAGYFYMAAYSADELRIEGFKGASHAEFVDCVGQAIGVPPANLGRASFSAGAASPGCNPFLRNCVSSTPVVAATWSRVKSFLGASPSR